MSREVDNRIAKMDLDGSGFINGAKKVQSAITELEQALQFKGAEKGAENVSSSVNSMQKSISAGAQEMTSDFTKAADAMADSMANAASEISASADKISDSMSSGFQNASSNAQTALGAMAAGISAHIASIVKTVAVVGAVAGTVALAVSVATGSVGEKVSSVIDSVKKKLEDAKSFISETLTGGISSLTEKISKVGADIKKVVSTVVGEIRTTLQTAFPETYELISGWVQQIISRFNELREAAKAHFSAIFSGVSETFSQIASVMEGVLEGIRTRFAALAEGISSFFSKISEKVSSLASHFKKSKDEIKDLEDAMASVGDAAKNAAAGLTDSADAAGDTSDAMQNASDAAKNVADAFAVAGDSGEDVSQSFGDVGQSAADAVDGLNDASDSSAQASGSLGDVGQNAADAADRLNAFGEGGKEAAEGAEQVGTESAKAAENVEKTGDAAEGAGSKMSGAFAAINNIAKALGHDLGELPFKLDEIADKGGAVGTVVSAGLGLALDKVKEFAGSALPLAIAAIGDKLRGVKDDMKDVSDGSESSSNAVKAIGDAAEIVGGKFTALGAVAFGALERIGQKAVDVGAKLIKSLSVDQISQGWGEYELKMNSVQTIMSGTGESMERVNQKLDELNEYADKTIYSFSDMTSNIGKFTNQGVKLDDAVEAIQGISNVAALAGANSQQASHAMYNFAQALSTGHVLNTDWKSIENAMMATTEFKEELIKTGLELGTLKREGDQVVSLTKDNNGHVSDAFSAMSWFRDNLKSQWLTNDVLIQTLKKFTDETTDLGQRAIHAAQDVKTASQLMDTLKEAVGSGWARTFELIIGNFEDAKKLWTGVNNLVSPIIDSLSDARNGLLEGWRALGGREELLSSLKSGFENFIDILKAAKEGLETFIPPLTATKLKDFTSSIGSFIDKVKLNDKQLGMVKDIFEKIGEGATKAKSSVKEIVDTFVTLVDKSGALSRLKETISGLFGQKDIFSKDGLLKGISDIVDKVNSFAQNNVFGALRDHLEEIASVASNLATLFKAIFDGLKTIFSSAGEIFGVIGDAVKEHMGDIEAFANGVISVVKGVIEAVVTFISKNLGNIKKWLPTVLDVALDIVGRIGKALQKIGDFFSDHAEGIAKFASAFLVLKTIVPIGAKAAGAVLKVAGAVKTLQTVIGILTNAKFVAAASKVITPIATGLGEMAVAAAEAAAAMAPAVAVISLLGGAFGIHIGLEKMYQAELKANAEETYGLSDAEQYLIDKINETKESYDHKNEARTAAIDSINKESAELETLADDLREIVDENGKVKKGKENLANDILGQLNEALGLELELVDGQIKGYKELNEKLDETIEKKRILALINNGYTEYTEAKENAPLHKVEYDKSQDALDTAYEELANAKAEKKEIEALYTAYDTSPEATLSRILSGGQYTNPYQKDLDQINQNIAAIEEKIYGDGTENNPGLLQTRNDAQSIYSDDVAVISNYKEMRDTYYDDNSRIQDKTNAAGKWETKLKRSGVASTEELKDQADKLVTTYDGMMEMVNDGVIDAKDTTVQTTKYLKDVALDEYAKSVAEEEHGPGARENLKGTQDIINKMRVLSKMKPVKTDKKAINKLIKEDKEAGGALRNVGKKASEGSTDGIKSKVAKKTSGGGGKIPAGKENDKKDFKNATDAGSVKDNVVGVILGGAGKAADALHAVFGEVLPKTGAEGQKIGQKLAEGTTDGIKSKLPEVSGAGGKIPETYSGGMKGGIFTVTAAAAELPESAADGASSNTGVMQEPGKAGTGEYASGMESSSDQAGTAGETIVSAAEMRAEAQAPVMGQAGSEGGGEYASGMESTSGDASNAAGTVAGAAKDALDNPDTYSSGYNKGLDWGQGLEDGLNAKYEAVAAAAQKLAKMIRDVTAFALVTGSPSKVAIQFGNWWGEGLVIGMENLEGAVKEESMTLSQSLVSSGQTPLSSLGDILNGNYTDSRTLTPVLDLSEIQNGANQLRSIVDNSAYGGFWKMDVSDLARSSAYDKEQSTFDAQALKELQAMREEMSQFKSQLGKVSVRMDTGALVGQLAGPMDGELGRAAALKGRR